MSLLEGLNDQGFCTLRGALDGDSVAWARNELEKVLANPHPGVLVSDAKAYGVRNLLTLWPEAGKLLEAHSVREFLQQVFSAQGEPRLVRGLFFDKPPGKTWTLPWHRDRTVAVQTHVPEAEALGFTNPTTKAKIAHYIAPTPFLEQMITLRFSLDAMTPDNGPLVVMTGSHQNTNDTDDDLPNMKKQRMHEVHCGAGDAFAMRPLLAHSSLLSTVGTKERRRVVHLEFSAQPLPEPLQWYECYKV